MPLFLTQPAQASDLISPDPVVPFSSSAMLILSNTPEPLLRLRVSECATPRTRSILLQYMHGTVPQLLQVWLTYPLLSQSFPAKLFKNHWLSPILQHPVFPFPVLFRSTALVTATLTKQECFTNIPGLLHFLCGNISSIKDKDFCLFLSRTKHSNMTGERMGILDWKVTLPKPPMRSLRTGFEDTRRRRRRKLKMVQVADLRPNPGGPCTI